MTNYPNRQGSAAGAIPVWNVGPPPGIALTSLNVSGADAIIKAAPGSVYAVIVTQAGSAPGALHDVATDAPAAGNKVFVIPAAVGVYLVQWPFQAGILVVPGAGQILNIAYI